MVELIMESELTINQELDARGLFCPMPVIKVNKIMKQMKPGEILRVHATDPGSQRDMPAWAKKTGNTLIKVEINDGVYSFVFRKEA